MDASKQMKSQNFMFLELAASFLELSCCGVGAWVRGVYSANNCTTILT